MNPAELVSYSPASNVTEAARTRRSLRDFLPREVPTEQLESLLETAARAPSGTNMQPWNVYVVRGETRDRLCEAVCHAFDNEQEQHQGEGPRLHHLAFQ